MNKRTSAIVVFAFLCVVCLVHASYYYPRLPDQVAHHFGASGEPDGWGSKMDFLSTYLGAVGIMAASILGIGLFMPKIPNSMISLPNKDYWLAPERRPQTLGYMSAQLLWMGSLTMLFLLDMAHQSFMVHLGRAAKLSHLWITVGAYMALTMVWCVAIRRKFNTKETSV